MAIWLLLTLASCSPEADLSPDNPDNPDKEQGTGTVTLTLAAQGVVKTRTVLTGPKPLQHVKQVHLYIFKGSGDNAVYSEKKTDIEWADCTAGSNTQTTPYTLTLKPGDYRFLAVGLDEASASTYTIDAGLTENVTTFANAKATLAAGQTKGNIAISELFAGWAEATDVKESGNAAVTIDLYRRVAGVLGYFKNVPDGVQTIEVRLYEDQNTDVPLRKPTNNNTAEDDDFGTKVTGSTDNAILLSISKTDNTYTYTTADGTQATGVFKSAYVLPKQAPTDAANPGVTHTLKVRTLDADGNEVKSYNVVIQSSVDGSDNTTDKTPAEKAKFPLYANQLYSIGTEEEPVNLEEEGNEPIIIVNPNWEGIGEIIPLE